MRLIFLHAFPLDGRMWNEQVIALTVPVATPTLYPLGRSIESWATAVLRAVPADAVKLVVVGCSMGGSCALEMARQAGERIAALVLVGSKAGHRPEPNVRDAYVAAIQAGGLADIWPRMAETFFGPAASVEVREAAHDIAAEQRPVDLVVAVEAFHGRPDATDVVKAWHKPLVVVSGDCDGVVSVEKSMGIAAMAPHGELHIVPNCGHFVNMEQPAIFNAILRDVVRSVEATSA